MRNPGMMAMGVRYDSEFRANLAEDHIAIARYPITNAKRKATDTHGEMLDKNYWIPDILAEPGFEQEMRYVAIFIGKYAEVDRRMKGILKQCVPSKGLFLGA